MNCQRKQEELPQIHLQRPVPSVPRRLERSAALENPRIPATIHDTTQSRDQLARIVLLTRRAQPHHSQAVATRRIHLQRSVQELEQVLADLLRLRGVLPLVVQVPIAHLVLPMNPFCSPHHADRLPRRSVTAIAEQRRVLQQPLTAHDSVHARLRNAAHSTLSIRHSAVRDYLDSQKEQREVPMTSPSLSTTTGMLACWRTARPLRN